MKKCLRIAAAAALSCSMAFSGAQAAGNAKNVILLISDGWGYNHILATDYYNNGSVNTNPYADFPVYTAMSTYMGYWHVNGEKLTKGYDLSGTFSYDGYDGTEADSRFDYMLDLNYTDSAAAVTAMATGQKAYGGAIGVNPYAERITNIAEIAQQQGKATGDVSSVQFSHATPAGFGAHNASRNNYVEIAREMLLDSKLDVIMGAGHPLYNNDGQPEDGLADKYCGGIDFFNAIKNSDMAGFEGNSVEDIDGDGQGDVWSFIDSRADFQALASGETPKRVFGLAQVNGTLQYNRAGSGTYKVSAATTDQYNEEAHVWQKVAAERDSLHVPGETPFNANVPTLAEMTAAAINVLDNDPDGFFLHVEGGAVDWAGHGNWLGRMIEEQTDFNNAVQVVIDWVEQNSSWDETLVIVTGDHETGYLTGPNPTKYWSPITNTGQGNLPGWAWNSGQHTNQLIPLYAKGPSATLCNSFSDQMDDIRGKYMDNTEIFKVMKSALTGSGVEVADETPIEFDTISNYPNPFNPTTTISYRMSLTGSVKLTVYDMLGRKVATLVDEVAAPGEYAVQWNADGFGSGTYFAKVELYGNKSLTHKMTLIK